MPYRDLWAFIDYLDKEGELIRIKEELSPRFEISAILRELGQKESPAALFQKVNGYSIPVIGNLFGSRRRIALALEVTQDRLLEEYQRRLGQPIPPVKVDRAPVKDIIIKDDIDILKTLPVLTNHVKDVSPYITQGIVFTTDLGTGRKTMGLHRIQVRGKNRLGAWIAESIVENAKKKGQDLDVAIVIGVDPALLLAATSMAPTPIFDKFALAGGLRGEPVEVVSGETVDLQIPANAMFVLEGQILTQTLELDGPFGEGSGYYISANSPDIEIRTITHQKSPIYSVTQPFTLDNSLLVDVFAGTQLSTMLRRLVPHLKEAFFSMRNLLLVMSIDKQNEWEAKQALYLSLAMFPIVKYAIVVDIDVDIHSREDVLWAMAGRCQPDKDVVILRDLSGTRLDPSIKEDNLSSKVGIDATKSLDYRQRFERVAVPAEAATKAIRILREYLPS